jgi:glycosyltransferase involved in cell wall biosynthesis
MKPTRILHVIGGMHRAGIETWLMHVYRRIDRSRFNFDFLVHTTDECGYDSEIRSLGGTIIPCMHPSQPRAYSKNFRRILQEHGPFDVVHSHVHYFSGFVMKLAHHAGVPARIIHSHNDTTPVDSNAGITRKMYLRLMEHWTNAFATAGLAASLRAASSFFGQNWRADGRWSLLYYGIDFAPFNQAVNQHAVREELGLPRDAFVIGHVGRFHEQKNHEFLIEIFSHIAARDCRAHLLLLGEGPLEADVRSQVSKLGLTQRVTFAGVRSDVPRVMAGAMDLFLFPSRYEGLGLVLVEAQAAGLPCVASDVIPPEADVVQALCRRMSLNQTASAWADRVLGMQAPAISRSDALAVVEQSHFNILTHVQKIERMYGELSTSGYCAAN